LQTDLTQEAIETIRELLKIQKGSFPKGEQLAVEQPAEQPAIESPESE
jgi:hypothetical protein